MQKTYIYNGQETNYIITSDGKVFNKKTNRELKGTFARNEYRSVQLTIDGKPKSFMVHRLVAEMFCENPNGHNIVDHIDRNKYNNNYTNLRWVDYSANALNAEKSRKVVINNIEDIDLSNWKSLKEFPNYMVNKEGQIINIKTKHLLNGSIRNGYIRIIIKGKFYSLHKLIWETFNDKIPENGVIDHIDGNRMNNNLSNLRLVTQSENIFNSHKNGHGGDVQVKQYDLQGNYIAIYSSMQEASKKYGVTGEAIKSAAKRRGTCAGYFWIRADDDITIEEVMQVTKVGKPTKSYVGVTQYDLEGNLIAHYNSLAEGARAANCSSSTVRRAADQHRPGSGFIWVLDTQKIEDFNIHTSPENSLIAGKP